MKTEILAKYAARPLPRYTSYPTAAQFTPEVGPDLYAWHLQALPEHQPVSLYVHIPFCDTLCWFCGCHTKVTQRYKPVSEYLERLKREIDLVAAQVGPRTVRHLHWGGGSPTILTPEDIIDLEQHLFRRFSRTEDSEFAVEIDPRRLGRETVLALAQAGVNRVSIGVQDIDPQVQQAVNRLQPLSDTVQAMHWLADSGITQVNIDLMYGLPHQTVDSVAATAQTIAGLNPSRLSVFGYAHVPWMKRHMRQIETASLPDTEERWRQAEAISAVLRSSGYVAVGLDHFARPDDPLAHAMLTGHMRRNFQGYTVDAAEALIGLGASAIGSLPRLYAQNATPIDRYSAAIDAGHFAAARGVLLSDDDLLRRAIIERLMCDLSVDVATVCHQFNAGPDRFLPAFDALRPLADDGIVHLDAWRVTVPREYRALLRLAAVAFDAHTVQTETPRHARAV